MSEAADDSVNPRRWERRADKLAARRRRMRVTGRGLLTINPTAPGKARKRKRT